MKSLVVLATGAALLAGTLLFALPGRDSAASPPGPPAPPSTQLQPTSPGGPLPPPANFVAVRAWVGSRPLIAVPRSFLGLSAEYWGLPHLDADRAVFARLLAHLHPTGDGPLTLRIGGDSADRTQWGPRSGVSPIQVFRLTRAWLRRTAAVVAQNRLGVILDLNLASASPREVLGFARAARAAIGRRLIGFEVGNEPDLYHRQLWYRRLVASRAGPGAAVSTAFSLSTYARDFKRYARTLAGALRGIPLLGPAVANPAVDARWVTGLIATDRAALGAVSGHRYPLSKCASPYGSRYPTIERLLAPASANGMATSMARAIAAAHAAQLKFRLTELNSVTCGGRAGVSDAFATALWAPDALFALLWAGIDSVNFHFRDNAWNAPAAVTPGGLAPRPVLYGLILFARALGAGARLLPSSVAAPTSLGANVWAVRTARGAVHAVLLNKGPLPIRLLLRLPARSAGALQRLVAPTVSSSSGVRLAGQWLDDRMRWRGRRRIERVGGHRGIYAVVLPAGSAALLEVRGRG